MTENKRFTIDVETENYENAYFEDDKFLCYEDDYDAILNRLNELAEENQQLKQQRVELFIRERDTKNELRRLQERNNRQCRELDNLYHLIEKQDWKTLTGIIQELKEADELLQKLS